MSNLTESTLNNEITMDKSFKDNDEDDLFQSAISVSIKLGLIIVNMN